jgi:hypothetical protein
VTVPLGVPTVAVTVASNVTALSAKVDWLPLARLSLSVGVSWVTVMEKLTWDENGELGPVELSSAETVKE